MEQGIFPPVVADMLIILSFAVSIIALIGAALSITSQKQVRDRLHRVSELEEEVRKLQEELAAQPQGGGKAQAKRAEPPLRKAAPDAKELSAERQIWQDFIDDYNSLAASMNVPRADEACEAFISNYKLQVLRLDAAQMQPGSGQDTPVFVPADDVKSSGYWAWPLPGAQNRFVVVPNPLHGYTKTLHEKGGMKETFASNYKTGNFKLISVKIPAVFRQDKKLWKIDQPGVIRVK